MTTATLRDAIAALRAGATTTTMTRCPAHEDSTASLSVSIGTDGRILAHCHAGCSYGAITDAAGIPPEEMAPPRHLQAVPAAEIVYDYRDERGGLLYQVVRRPPKQFRQRRPQPGGGWSWSLGDVRRVLYRLPELLAAPPEATIYVAEGERDVENLRAIGLVATTSPGGAGKWRREYADHLRGRRVVILPDRDEPGRRHAEQVATSLRGIAAEVRTVELPGLPEHGDVSDWLAAGGTCAELERLTEASAPPTAPTETPAERRPSAADVLIGIGRQHRHVVDERGDGYAVLDDARGTQTMRIRSRAYRQALQAAHYHRTGRAATGEAVATAVATLDAMARAEGQRVRMHTRMAHVDGAAWLDMADGTGRAVRVTADGWEIVDRPAIYWRRYAHQEPLPDPVHGGDLRELLEHIRAREEDRVLLLVWIVVALLADLDRAMPILHGGPGAGKTTVARMLRRLLDPSATDVLRLPRGEHELALIMDHHAVPALDNLSGLPGWASDMLCTGVTGGAYVARELYTDGDEVLISYRVAPILTGITIPATAPDLLDRSLLIELEPIGLAERREARELWAAYEAARPRLIGAMLDTLSAAMRIYPTLRLGRLERLADWTRWAAAVAEALSYGSQALLDSLARQREERATEVLQSDAVAEEIVALMADRDEWIGTAGDLHARRPPGRGGRGEWPSTPQGIRSRVPRLTSVLATRGIRIERLDRAGHTRKRLWRVTRTPTPEVCIPSSASSASSADATPSASPHDPAVRTIPRTIPEQPSASSAHRPQPGHHQGPHGYAVLPLPADDADDADDPMRTSRGDTAPDWAEV